MDEVVVEFASAVVVDVRVPGAPTKPSEVLREFGKWRMDNHVYSLPGTLGGGPGWHHGAYTQPDASRISKWFNDRGIVPEALGDPVDTSTTGA